jgi:hypothetical protein
MMYRVSRIKRNPNFEKNYELTQETKAQYNQSLSYDMTMFGQFPVFTLLSYLRKQMSLLSLLSILKISELKNGFHFILITL